MILRVTPRRLKFYVYDPVTESSRLEIPTPFSKPLIIRLGRPKVLKEGDTLSFQNWDAQADRTIRKERLTESGFVSAQTSESLHSQKVVAIIGAVIGLSFMMYLILWATSASKDGPIDVYVRGAHGDEEVSEALKAVKELFKTESVIAVLPANDLRNKALRAAIVRGCDTPCYEIPVSKDTPGVYLTVFATLANTGELPVVFIHGRPIIGYDAVRSLYYSGNLHTLLRKPVPRRIITIEDLMD